MSTASRIFSKSARSKYAADPFLMLLPARVNCLQLQVAPSNCDSIKQAIRDTEVKLLALKYHIDNMERFEKEFTKEDIEILGNLQSSGFESVSRPIDFEFESFLFKARAALEILARTIALASNQSRIKPKNLQRVLTASNRPFAKQVLTLITEYRIVFSVLQGEGQQLSPRDWIAHYGSLYLTPHLTRMVEGKVAMRAPSLDEKTPVPASIVSRIILFALERLVKESFAIVFSIPKPTVRSFLVSGISPG